MKKTIEERMFDALMFWTIVTGIFAWLPLVRILGRPDGYSWAILGLSGTGTEGPFWIFVLLTAWVLTMLFTTFRGPRAVAYPLLLLWHVALTGVVVAGVVQGGTTATWQGQGLRWAIPLWVLIVPFAAFTVLAALWIARDRRRGGKADRREWSRASSVRLAGSLVLLVVALILFRAGDNYNWVTAAAILTTIGHWALLVDAIAAAPSSV